MRSIFILTFSILIGLVCTAQAENSSSVKIAPDALRTDFLLLRDTLQKIHPGIYRYKSKATVNKTFDSCFAAITDSMTVTDFYALTSFFVASIEDGHTNCRLPKQSLVDFVNKEKVFPALLMFIHNRAFIFCCNQHSDLKEAELLSIDSNSLSDIVTKLFNYIPSDGSIQSRKNWELPDNFPLLYRIIYGAKDIFHITYKTKDGVVKTTTLKADFIKNVVCGNPFPKPPQYLNLDYKQGKVAVLTIKTFFDGYLQQSGENFRSFLDSAFRDLNRKKAERLLIDLRGNQGGNDGNGILLYSYLVQKPFQYYASQNTVTKNFRVSDHPNLGVQQPNENAFKGKVYFLIDGRSFSAAAEIASVAKSNNRGLFFGEETGGGYYGNTSGDEPTVTLPHSHITCRIPMVKYSMAVKKTVYKDRGVLPDFPVSVSINDLIENKDGQLEYSLKRIESY